VAARESILRRLERGRGQATLLVLGVVAVLLVGVGVLFGFGQALGAKGRHQRAADLAAVSVATKMRDDYPRLFEPVVLANGLPNPRHLPTVVYLARARGAAVRAGRRNGVRVRRADVSFTSGFAPTRVRVRVRGSTEVAVSGTGRERIGCGPAPRPS